MHVLPLDALNRFYVFKHDLIQNYKKAVAFHLGNLKCLRTYQRNYDQIYLIFWKYFLILNKCHNVKRFLVYFVWAVEVLLGTLIYLTYLSSTYCVLRIDVGTRNTAMNKTDTCPCNIKIIQCGWIMWVNLDGIMLSETGQSQSNKWHRILYVGVTWVVGFIEGERMVFAKRVNGEVLFNG